jgi:hypothetical protein
MKPKLRTGILIATTAAGLAFGQTPYGNRDDPAVGKNATAGDTQAPKQTLPPPGAPTWNPGFGKEVENKALSGDTPETNSTLQKDRDGNMGKEYFGWIGLLGLAGLFGLGRGSNPAPRT